MTLAVFNDYPGLESSLTKFHDFPGRVVTLAMSTENNNDAGNNTDGHMYHNRTYGTHTDDDNVTTTHTSIITEYAQVMLHDRLGWTNNKDSIWAENILSSWTLCSELSPRVPEMESLYHCIQMLS